MRRQAWAALVLAAACSSGSGGKASSPAPPADAQLAQLQTSMTELLERLDVLNDRMTRIEQAQADQQVAGRRPPVVETRAPTPVLSGGPVSLPDRPSPPPPAATSSAVAGAQIAESYRNAVTLYGSSRIAESRAAFQKVFDADPHGELADNALFWIGETFYAAGQYGEAMRYYTRVTRDYSDQNKAPDAMFKLALSYERTSDLALAKKTLEEVISKYPYSTSAAAAKAELKRIKY